MKTKVLLAEHVTAGIAAEAHRLGVLKVLRAAATGGLPSRIADGDSSGYPCKALRELFDAGHITGTPFQAVNGPWSLSNARMTLPGRELLAVLEQNCIPDHATNPSGGRADKHKNSIDTPIIRIGIGIAVALLAAAALWGVAHWSGILLG